LLYFRYYFLRFFVRSKPLNIKNLQGRIYKARGPWHSSIFSKSEYDILLRFHQEKFISRVPGHFSKVPYGKSDPAGHMCKVSVG